MKRYRFNCYSSEGIIVKIQYRCLICGYIHEWDDTWSDEKKAEVKAEVDAHHNQHIVDETTDLSGN